MYLCDKETNNSSVLVVVLAMDEVLAAAITTILFSCGDRVYACAGVVHCFSLSLSSVSVVGSRTVVG